MPSADGRFAGAVMIAANLVGIGAVLYVGDATASAAVSAPDRPFADDPDEQGAARAAPGSRCRDGTPLS
ncbi:hypothetical protein PJ985_01120 [Streptomyces sp. ACA25]|uniref:hypothetical protein n=1 Tax=Streptomyces sp. ACA25 TaxID=3022596 RepID=UPI002306EEC5|nr:hypothetical protein [Streptomyces sp. ACA25]MDB1086175.1 hypothetical protein [Streptomyces sp. ACA25]